MRHEVACEEWSENSQPGVQGCLQSLSALLVTVSWKARGNVQGSFEPNEATGLGENWKDEYK
ncbi:hypothetical protein ccbrp13_33270 [Ktedonobacteria bacterium brp13]|nr:hypothetical protein ccbrp13_33270 [Ktedonobacteria bacterium brp13]